MAKGQNTIEINGNLYDASTGAIITKSQTTAKKTPKPAKLKQHTTTPQVLDGFTKRKPAPSRTASTTSATSLHRKPSKSQTLMRSTVKKPSVTKVHAKTAIVAPKPQPKSEQHIAGADINPERAARAFATARSRFISKFGKSTNTAKTIMKPTPIDVHTPPARPSQTSQQANKHNATTTTKDALTEQAINSATTHVQSAPQKNHLHHKIAKRLHMKPRTLLAVTVGFFVVAIGSYITYVRVPDIAMQFAVARAGVKASMPNYKPAGFSLEGPINYNRGEISLAYESNSDERSFKVIQRTSQWNSETLLDNFIVQEGKQFLTLQSNGRTIYIYEGSNATWVDGGVWYQIEGNSSLTSDQLLRIANSL